MSLVVRPITLRQANAFVELHHRHHKPARGCVFCVSVLEDDAVLRGVAIVGRPLARMLQDGRTCEVLRVCTDGTYNVCSKLYATVAKTARTMGYDRIITYTLPSGGRREPPSCGLDARGVDGRRRHVEPRRPRADRRSPDRDQDEVGRVTKLNSDHSKLADAKETVLSVIVMLAGLTEPWDRYDYPERCAFAENELRALDSRLASEEQCAACGGSGRDLQDYICRDCDGSGLAAPDEEER